MISNAELFRKMMKAGRAMRINAMKDKCGMPPMGPGCGPHPGMPMGPGPCHGPHHMMPPMPPKGPGCGPVMPPMPPRNFMSRERLLVIISEYEGGVRQKELAERAGINASSTSEVVSKLEDDGYLIRTVDENDRRATILKLTEMGSARAAEIKDEREESLKDVFAALSEDEKQTLSDILDKIIG